MTYSGIFDEVDLKQVKKLKAEIKKLKKIIDDLETHMNLKDFEIQNLKERLKTNLTIGIFMNKIITASVLVASTFFTNETMAASMECYPVHWPRPHVP